MRLKPKNLGKTDIEILVADTQKEKNYPICGYISAKSDGTFSVCKQKAGAGTQHTGEGRCRDHGGCGRPMTTGNWGIYKPEEIQTLFQKVSNYHTLLMKDHEETLKYANILVEELSKTPLNSEKDSTRLEVLRRCIETKAKVEQLQFKRLEKDTLSFLEVSKLFSQVLTIIDQEVTDIVSKKRIFSKIKDLLVEIKEGGL